MAPAVLSVALATFPRGFAGVASVTIGANTNNTTFTLPTLDDALAEGEHEAYITHRFVTNATEYQDAFALQEVVRVVDNDSGGVVVDPVSGLTTTESNGTATRGQLRQTTRRAVAPAGRWAGR